MKPVLSLAVSCLLMTILDIAPVSSCSDNHPTRPVRDLDIVVTLDADNISSNEAKLNAIVVFSALPAYESFNQVGFEFCEDNNEENTHRLVVENVEEKDEVNFSLVANELKPDTKYMFRAFLSCTNKHTYYGIWRKFSTLKE